MVLLLIPLDLRPGGNFLTVKPPPPVQSPGVCYMLADEGDGPLRVQTSPAAFFVAQSRR